MTKINHDLDRGLRLRRIGDFFSKASSLKSSRDFIYRAMIYN